MKQLLSALLCTLALSCPLAQAQTTAVSTEYLMTLYAPLEPPQPIDSGLTVYNVREGGWVKGPKISGALIAPGADWLRTMPGGSAQLDVRASIRTDDGALVFIAYGGVISHTPESMERLVNGELLKADDHYFITAPTFQTSSEKYAWLNHVQCVGKMVEVKMGEDSYVKYDIFVVR
jgi:hypothetical protein